MAPAARDALVAAWLALAGWIAGRAPPTLHEPDGQRLSGAQVLGGHT